MYLAMDRRGSVLIKIVVGIIIFITGSLLVHFVTPEVTTFRTAMNCAAAENITDGTKMACLVGDIAVPYFIIIFISFAGAMMFEEFIRE